MADIRLEWLSTIMERHPGWRPVLEEFGIDGRQATDVTLAAAADRAGADLESLVTALGGPPRPPLDCAMVGKAPVPAIIDHLVQVHHGLLWRQFPVIAAMIERAQRTDPGDTELAELGETFARLRRDLEPHLESEETVLFPTCRDIAAACSWPSFHIGSLAPRIDVVAHEHDHAGVLLEELEAAAARVGGASGMVDAGDLRLEVAAVVQEVIADLRVHLAEESEVLIPAVLRLAEELAAF